MPLTLGLDFGTTNSAIAAAEDGLAAGGPDLAGVGHLRRKDHDPPAGGRLEVTKCSTPLKWVRLDSAPFTDRLVRKFRLPVTGWRGQ